ncbi:C40 family peptidase [Coralloluteibacterium stylophorae]|uniref:C40 family peptidase n=2 Tax=Coralloluteibacterium stylophorae TaxID=1776034 RepID=A0AAP2CAP1_9GAMM|nr:C40 family peptidase [Coralloluteibacterium stylophorae]MBS7456460.1 C40 family peptidase [Coralloluteibacterium stylophorae]
MRARAASSAAVKKAAHYPDRHRQAPAPRPRPSALLGIALCLGLAACGGHQATRPTSLPESRIRDWRSEGYDAPTPVSPRANDVLMRALGLVGTPYRYGGNTPDSGFDCSGLVVYVYRDVADLALPRTSRAMNELDAPRIRLGQIAPGDLVFFGSGRSASHVGIYVGEGRFVHAPNSGGTVRMDSLDGYWWKENYLGARRVLR